MFNSTNDVARSLQLRTNMKDPMVKKLTFLLCITLLKTSLITSQTIELNPTLHDDGGLNESLTTNKLGTWYKVYPKDILVPDSFTNIRYIHSMIDYAQVVYQSCRSLNDAIWNDDRLAHMINRWGVDTIDCSPHRINSFINATIATGPNDELYYAIDQNNNLSLLDEEFHLLSDASGNLHQVMFERYDNNAVQVDTATIRLGNARISSSGQFQGLDFAYSSHKEGLFISGLDTITIAIHPDDYYVYHKDPDIILTTSDGHSETLRVNQYWQLNDDYFKITIPRKNGSEMDLVKMPDGYTPISNQLGFKAPPIIDNGSDLLANSNYDFTYIYFWNMDCAPCLQQLPKLQKSYDGLESKGKPDFDILLISVDKAERTRSFLKKKGIKFKNIETLGNSSLYNNYAIEFFPTKYVVNGEGKVIITPKMSSEFRAFWKSRQ